MLVSERHQAPAPSAPPHVLPMPVLMQQLAHELGALQLMAADMEASVDDMIERHAGVLDARSIQNLQLLDILNQTILALATFAGNVAALSSADWRIDVKAATADLKLASLAQRLAKGGTAAGKAQADSYELFSDT